MERVETIAERLRQEIRRTTVPDGTLLALTSDDEELHRDLKDLHGMYALVDLAAPPPATHRGMGRLRRALAAVLYPELQRQTAHNGATTRLIAYLLLETQSQASTIAALEARLERQGQSWASSEPPE